MSLFAFLKGLLFHIISAAIVLFAILLLGEYFVPGSVLPFVNLIDAIIPLLAGIVLFLLLKPGDSSD
jgi:hypothetical protein